VGDFSFDLRPELVRGAPQLGKKASGLTSHLRQLLRPKENEGQEEKEDGVGKTHGFIIMGKCKGGNAAQRSLVYWAYRFRSRLSLRAQIVLWP
jgi:hypothetical protein